MYEAQQAGWKAVGLEVSAAAVRAVRNVPECVVAGDALQLPFSAASFDVVTLWDVLEHLAQPRIGCREAARVLRPGGRLALTTGDVGSPMARLSGARWHLYNLPEHLYFFTRESLHRLLEACGFRIEIMRAESARYPLGYLAERLGKTLFRVSGGVPRFPGHTLQVPMNLWDVVTVIARKVGSP